MKFKCIQSGNIIEFTQEHEIAEMRKHSGYAEVVPEAPVAPAKTTTAPAKKVTKDESSING